MRMRKYAGPPTDHGDQRSEVAERSIPGMGRNPAHNQRQFPHIRSTAAWAGMAPKPQRGRYFVPVLHEQESRPQVTGFLVGDCLASVPVRHGQESRPQRTRAPFGARYTEGTVLRGQDEHNPPVGSIGWHFPACLGAIRARTAQATLRSTRSCTPRAALAVTPHRAMLRELPNILSQFAWAGIAPTAHRATQRALPNIGSQTTWAGIAPTAHSAIQRA